MDNKGRQWMSMGIDAFSNYVLRFKGLPPLGYVLGMAMFGLIIHHYGVAFGRPTTGGAAFGGCGTIMADWEAPNIAMQHISQWLQVYES